MGQCACFGGAEQERRAEADRAESQEARAKAAEAAQRSSESRFRLPGIIGSSIVLVVRTG
ncbi:hypothetical protein E2562_013707 [Oryza meyeriana var. granulata]|uniref:Uncharacterized protein n=1 Tax=Oryza meyeriana var. granulata TaxID=110450 RepID=A0A6G1BJW5_9ORYZ|nr:hypothetical protein E2562_013707 [Oryza meyeriana var. granulata]